MLIQFKITIARVRVRHLSVIAVATSLTTTKLKDDKSLNILMISVRIRLQTSQHREFSSHPLISSYFFLFSVNSLLFRFVCAFLIRACSERTTEQNYRE
jgi:hypothetical protein